MHRIPPTERIRQSLDEVLSRGLDTEEDVAGVFFRLGVERLVQVFLHAVSRQLLEVASLHLRQEVSDYLGRERYWLRHVCDQRREPGHTCRSVSVRAQGLSAEGVATATMDTKATRCWLRTAFGGIFDHVCDLTERVTRSRLR